MCTYGTYIMNTLIFACVAATMLVCVLHSHRTQISNLVKTPHIVTIVVASNNSLTQDIQISIKEKAAYAKKHKYNFELTPQMNESRHAAWSKLIQVSTLVSVYPN